MSQKAIQSQSQTDVFLGMFTRKYLKIKKSVKITTLEKRNQINKIRYLTSRDKRNADTERTLIWPIW